MLLLLLACLLVPSLGELLQEPGELQEALQKMLLSSPAGPEIRPFPPTTSWRLTPGGGKFGDWSEKYMNRPLFKRSPWQFKRAPKRQCRMVKRKCSCRSSKFSAWVDCSKYLSRVLIKRADQGHPEEPWMKQMIQMIQPVPKEIPSGWKGWQKRGPEANWAQFFPPTEKEIPSGWKGWQKRGKVAGQDWSQFFQPTEKEIPSGWKGWQKRGADADQDWTQFFQPTEQEIPSGWKGWQKRGAEDDQDWTQLFQPTEKEIPSGWKGWQKRGAEAGQDWSQFFKPAEKEIPSGWKGWQKRGVDWTGLDRAAWSVMKREPASQKGSDQATLDMEDPSQLGY